MPWNQPGGSGGRDPWGQRGGQQGPPDLDEIVRKVQRRFGSLFGGGKGGGGGGGGDLAGKFGFGMLLIIVLAIWAASGIYIVREGESGVVLRFGQYVETVGAGLHWRMPFPLESNEVVNVQKIHPVQVGYRTNEITRAGAPVPKEALMLTMDENIIDIQFAVQYRIKDPKDVLFNVSDPRDDVVRSATESAVREIVGKSTMDFVITGGRTEVAQRVKELLQTILDRYLTGIHIVTVEMQNAQPPAEVKAAFDDAVKAREDEVRLKNEAEAYSNDVIPRARGQAARVIQEAEGYKASVIARSEGEAARFLQILDEYRRAPDVTRERLYIEAVEEVLKNSSKILVDQKGSNNILYLPLDQIIQRRSRSSSDPEMNLDSGGEPGTQDERDTSRGRTSLRGGRG
jgi:membrane protease subunit HflK